MTTAPLTELHPDSIRLLALGGLGEIGMNMMALECRDQILLIDCGLMFPEAYMMGIDLVIPETEILTDRTEQIQGIVLTHGHEDHIGAIPFLWGKLGYPPIYGTGLTLGLLSAKFDEHQIGYRSRLHRVEVRQSVTLGVFDVEFYRATHSIVDGAGLAIRTPAGLVIHTGDFKLDPTPIDGETTDLARLAAYGEEGVLLLLSDSTNVEREGHTLSEQVVGDAFNTIMPKCQGWIVVATFSSNIHRIQQVVNAALADGRKILVNGRSMVANIAIARQLGYLYIPDDALITLGQMLDLPRNKVVIITTGSQGEPLSALSRIAMDDHKNIQLQEGDTVVLSSKFIPGNEKAISEVINHLYRRGAEVIYESTSEIHVSGHASQGELKLVLSLTRPRYFVPIHGEYRHLVKHAALARNMAQPPEQCVVLENGWPLTVSQNGIRREERVTSGRVFVDGKGVGDIGAMQLRDRSHLAHHGLVVALLALNQSSGEIVYGPELFTRGFVPDEGTQSYLDEACQVVRDMLAEHSLATLTDWDDLRVELRKCLRRFFNRTISRRPLILPVLLEL